MVGGTVPQRIASCMQALGRMLALPHPVQASMVLADKRRAAAAPTQDLVHAVANILGETAAPRRAAMPILSLEPSWSFDRAPACSLSNASVLLAGIKDPSKVSESANLAELGMDSLMGAEIKQTLERGYDVVLAVQEIRALSFGKLRAMSAGGDACPAPAATAPAPAAAPGAPAPAAPADLVQMARMGELVPKQVVVQLPSAGAGPGAGRGGAVFMVHPIEGVVDVLRGVARGVRGAVYGLQAAGVAPRADMAALARHYVAHVRALQPGAPYTLLGYSFGAGVAFEMALQLEEVRAAIRRSRAPRRRRRLGPSD